MNKVCGKISSSVFSVLSLNDELTALQLHCARLAVHGEVFQIHGTGEGEGQSAKLRQNKVMVPEHSEKYTQVRHFFSRGGIEKNVLP